jgi:Putative Actinobacterial Holin-X, holin superfamily III
MELQKASLTELLVQLVQQVEQLLAAHLRLAREEITQDGKRFAAQSAGAVLGGILAIQGVAFIGFSIYKALTLWLLGWAAALIVALFFLIGGFALAFVSIKKMSKVATPDRTIEETQETLAWLTRNKR